MFNSELLRGQRGHAWQKWASAHRAWLFLLFLLLLFALLGPGFLSVFNLQNMLTDMIFVLLLAIGQTFIVLSGGIDLSLGSLMGLSSVVSALVVSWANTILPFSFAVLAAILAGLLAGLLPGFITGWMVARLKVPPFLVTLGMSGIVSGIGYLLANGKPISLSLPGLADLGNNALLYVSPGRALTFFQPPSLPPAQMRDLLPILPFQLLITCILFVLCTWLLSQTCWGLHLYAIGGNREAARRAGVAVVRHGIQVYLFASLLSSTAGLFYLFRYTSGAADAGMPLLLSSVAAVIIGGASLSGGAGTMMGTLVGTLILAVIQNGLVMLSLDPFWQMIVIGLVVLLAVLVDRAKAHLSGTERT